MTAPDNLPALLLRIEDAFHRAWERSETIVPGGNVRLLTVLDRALLTHRAPAELEAALSPAIDVFEAYAAADEGMLRRALARFRTALRPKAQLTMAEPAAPAQAAAAS